MPRPVPPSRLQLLSHLVFGTTPLPVWEAEPCATAVADAVADVERRVSVDLVQIWPGEMAVVASAARAPSALLLPDCYTRQARRERSEAETVRHKLLWRTEIGKARRWESLNYPRATALACVSAVDAEELGRLAGRALDVVPLPIGDEWFAAPADERGTDVVFVGALDYRPNVEAVRWLADAIWPLVRVARPAARLHIVGRSPVTGVRDAVERCGAELHADVPDTRPWYWRAGVVVSPIRLGSGIRNKVLHAFACGAPLVATAASLEGIDCAGDVDVLVADDAPGFARAVVDSLARPEAARDRARRALGIARRHRTEHSVAALERFWDRAVGRPG